MCVNAIKMYASTAMSSFILHPWCAIHGKPFPAIRFVSLLYSYTIDYSLTSDPVNLIGNARSVDEYLWQVLYFKSVLLTYLLTRYGEILCHAKQMCQSITDGQMTTDGWTDRRTDSLKTSTLYRSQRYKIYIIKYAKWPAYLQTQNQATISTGLKSDMFRSHRFAMMKSRVLRWSS